MDMFNDSDEFATPIEGAGCLMWALFIIGAIAAIGTAICVIINW